MFRDATDEFLIDAFNAYQNIKGDEHLKINDGICFGSALCHAVFSYLGKSEWWKAILMQVEDWDKKSESLVSLVQLPGGENKMTLEAVMKMAANFLLHHQEIDLTKHEYAFTRVNRLQRELFEPQSDFKIITEAGIKTIKDRLVVFIRGHDALNEFVSMFKKIYPKNNVICLAYNEMKENFHVCALRCENQAIHFFNSNYGDAIVFHLISLWYMRGGRFADLAPKTLAFEILSLDHPISPALVELSNTLSSNSQNKIDGKTLRIITKLTPQLIPKILSNIEDEESFADVLADVESGFSPNTLQNMVSNAGAHLPQLFHVIDRSKVIRRGFAQALNHTFKHQTTLDILIRFAPNHLQALFDLVNRHSDLVASFSQCLLNEDNKGVSAFHRLIHLKPEVLPGFFSLIQSNERLFTAFNKAMLINSGIALHALVVLAPSYFSFFITLLENHPVLINNFAAAMCTTPSEIKAPLLHQIIKFVPDCFARLIVIAKHNLDLRAVLEAQINDRLGTQSVQKPPNIFSIFSPQESEKSADKVTPALDSQLQCHANENVSPDSKRKMV